MEKERNNKILKVIVSAVLAVSLLGGVIALSACKSDEKTSETKAISVMSSYTPAAGTGKTYYVAPDVERWTTADCDGSYENPYNILDLVGYGTSGNPSNISILEPGDTVLVKPGQYNLTTSVFVEKSGTYDNYITIMNAWYAEDGHQADYESESCVMSLYAEEFNGNNRGVTINSDYIYWYGIDVAGAGDNGMYIGGNHNVIENCQFYNNRDTGFQLGRKQSADTDIKDWPSYNLVKNCTSFNNYDNETYGENADGFGAKLTIGYGNMFDGCIAYRNSDDGWDLYAKEDTGNIGCVIIYNCMAFENGYLMDTQKNCNARFAKYSATFDEDNTNAYTTRDGDGNGFKLGGGSNEGDVKLYNCVTFNNRMHGVTDNSNPGTLQIEKVTAYNNCASIDNDSSSETFGQVKYDGGTQDDDCSNIDLSRWTYSYNTLADVLSVIDGSTCTASDAYRGATTNSMFVTSGGKTGYYVEGTVDADTKNATGNKGNRYRASSASSIFETTPALDLGVSTKFDENGVVGIDTGNIHFEMREADGTINVGDLLGIKDGADLKLTGVGADLSKKSWDDYTHYEYTCGQSSESAEADNIAAISNMIYLPVYDDAVYQNFKVVNSIWGVRIHWTSSDEDIVRVTKNVTYTTSNSSAMEIIVNRDADEDKKVTLTASFEAGGVSAEKSYELVVKKDVPSIGNIIVDGVEYGQAIVDQYAAFPEPEVKIENGSDYNGKLLDESLYTVETTYEYAPTATDTFDEIGVFTTSNAGVYKITLNISIKNPEAEATVTQTTYSYLIYVASRDASVKFVGTPTLTVDKNGFEISGDVSSPTGTSYVLKSDTELAGAGEDGEILATQIIESEDAFVEDFRTTSLTLNYEDANNDGYYVYCVLTSLDGTQVSEVYKTQANVVEISDTTGFDSMLSSSNSSTIYRLTNDIDYNGSDTGNSGTFKGLLNGMGHTVKNISTTKRAVFDTVDNGTIENIKFDNIKIDYSGASSSGTSTSSGLIGLMRGGYLYNIAATDLTVISNGQRVGGIVGDINVSSGGNERTTYIQLVSLVNTYTHGAYTTETTTGDGGETKTSIKETYTGSIIKGVERVGGIVGFIQAGGTDSWNKVYISDCFVYAYLTATAGIASGIVGRSDDRNANDYLEISRCYVNGVIESTNSGKSYLGGMIGQFTGTGSTRVYDCMSYCQIWFGNESLDASLKNASWIIGNYAANGDIVVSGCFGRCAEYNEEYGSTATTSDQMYSTTFWDLWCPLDMEYWEYVYYEGSDTRLVAPMVQLVFQGEWDF